MTIAAAAARRRRSPSGGSLREPWVSEDGRGEMEKKSDGKKRGKVASCPRWNGGVVFFSLSSPLFGLFLYLFDSLGCKVLVG